MRDEGYGVIELHGDLTPRERVKAMKDLANLEKSFVVATDIAARGIDIDGVSHVISLGFPKELIIIFIEAVVQEEQDVMVFVMPYMRKKKMR